MAICVCPAGDAGGSGHSLGAFRCLCKARQFQFPPPQGLGRPPRVFCGARRALRGFQRGRSLLVRPTGRSAFAAGFRAARLDRSPGVTWRSAATLVATTARERIPHWITARLLTTNASRHEDYHMGCQLNRVKIPVAFGARSIPASRYAA